MMVIETVNEIKELIRSKKMEGKTIGLVPTMGYLHQGHMSLVKASKGENDFTVMSIFINPVQFGPNEDFSRYPRDFERDKKLAEDEGVDVIFAPSANEMYPDGYKTYVNVEGITGKLCGKSRPGHFQGVTTVVNKLCNIVQPDKAYFGQKDAQQVIVIKKMVADLNMNVEIVTCPIVRETDFLAMSSRNTYLNLEQRKAALVLSRTLFEVEDMIKSGEIRKDTILKYMFENISSEKTADIDYIEVADADSLEDIDVISGKVLIALAVKFGTTRLIDNIIVEA